MNERRRTQKRVVKTPAKRRRDRRTVFVGVVFCLCFVGLFFRLWYLQEVYGDEYTQHVLATIARQHQNRASREIIPSRGAIVDRHMQPIASSRPVYDIFIDVILLHDGRRTEAGNQYWNETLDALSSELSIPRRELVSLFDTDDGHYEGALLHRTHHRYIARQVTAEVALPLIREFTHVHATEISQRWHQDPFFAPSVIGFIRGDAIWGIESQYDQELTGERGRSIWLQGEIEEFPVRDGYTIVTTLDADIQRLAQHHVNETFRTQTPTPRAVAMIVQDPNTGEILAMAEAPTFSMADPTNPDYFTDFLLRHNWDYLTNSEQLDSMNYIWRNFHTTDAYEPGSIFKPFVIAAAIEEGLIHPDEFFYCGWVRQIYDIEFPCWANHGRLSVREALYRSCNIIMVDIMERLTASTFYRYRGYFGFGDRTGIDFPGEASVSSPSVMYTLPQLGPVERATSSIGQGFNATTIQSINAFASLINGGNVMQPILVSHVVDTFGNVVYENRPHVVRRAISPQTSDILRRDMYYVVAAEAGTGRNSRIYGHRIGGKTGTGQQGNRDYDMASLTYIAYLPVQNPEFLVLMVVHYVHSPRERRLTAGGVVSPVVRDFFEDLIRMRSIPQSVGVVDPTAWEMTMGGVEMPDFRGQNLRSALSRINTDGGFDVIGSGTVIYRTIPAPGGLKPQTSPILFYMDESTRREGDMVFVPDVSDLTAEDASSVLRASGLNVALVTSDRSSTLGNYDPMLFARTFNFEDLFEPSIREDEYESPALAPQEPLPYIVYRQHPTAGREVERGMQVIIRAR